MLRVQAKGMPKPKHACVFCLGAKGDAPGNENLRKTGHNKNVPVCDYCDVLVERILREAIR